MSLPIPNLDDKGFSQIVEEARAMIPSTAPEWTDHNVHDPGITFIELFAWLAEIEHYRLNRTASTSFTRFFSLIGLTQRGQQAAEVMVALDFKTLPKGVLVAANTKVTAIGNESVPFETIRDTYLTTAKFIEVETHAGERVIKQTKAEDNLAGYYEAFGPSPEKGDSLDLGFEGWFEEIQGHLSITLFEDDLPAKAALPDGASGFEPSAKVRWEYFTEAGWIELPVIKDGTLNFSKSGDLIFAKPQPPKPRGDLNWIRALLVEGRYEIPPRIFGIRTNTIRARQVETIVNEDLGVGLGTPDQVVRLEKAPVFFDLKVNDLPFQAGEVLDWKAMVLRLAAPEKLKDSRQAALVSYVAKRLKEDAGAIIVVKDPVEDDEKYNLAQAFNRLLDLPDFYQRKTFASIHIPDEFSELEANQRGACHEGNQTRRFNRFLLQRVFPDLIVSDRVEIQTGRPVRLIEDEPNNWITWESVESFLQSGPDDRHYILDTKTGRIQFGNGLNGLVPQPAESIRARFYRTTQGEKGNLPASKNWQLGIEFPAGTIIKQRDNPTPAAGGADPESLDAAKARTREVFRKQSPVLTASDYENAALNTPGLRVARAKVIANFNPALTKLNLPGELTIIVVPQPAPKVAFPNAPPPVPSDGFLATVRNHLETLRLVTTNLHVIGPKYVPVVVRCTVFLKKRASESETLKGIKEALSKFLDPIHGGPDRNAGWPFGRSIFPSEIYQQLAKVPGVDYITDLALNKQKAGEQLRLPYNGLPAPAEHEVELIAFERRREVMDSVRGGDCRE